MKKTIRDIQDWQGKRVFLRVDFNVPQDEQGNITDDSRIRESLPTIQYLAERGARIVLTAHLGRPKGQPNPKYSLKPMAQRLRELLPQVPVTLADAVVSDRVTEQANALQPGQILMLENVRFEPGEEKNDAALAQRFAALADIFVNDAFGAAHRAHASTEGVGHYVREKVAGLLLEKEIIALSTVTEHPKRPLTAIIGGSKISTKITVLTNLLNKVDTLIIGGGMAYTFLLAQGYEVGNSIVEKDHLETARQVMQAAGERGVSLFIPKDFIVANAFSNDAQMQEVSYDAFPAGWEGVDIGPKTREAIRALLSESGGTVLWNGPLGVFEMANFSHGTRAVAETVAELTLAGKVYSVLGGGDTVAAIEAFNIPKTSFSHVSTGGGASLEYLEGKVLPGIAILDEAPAKAHA